MTRIVALAGAALLASAAAAQEATEAGAEGPWSGKATLGYLATSGNTDSANLNTGFEVTYTTGSWQHALRGKAIRSSQDEQTIAEAYELGWKTEYRFSEFNYAFGRVLWRKDRFSGYDHQLSETIGYGRRILDSERHTLNAEVGLGARQLETQTGDSESDVILLGALDYSWRFTETAEFVQEVIIESGSTNTYLESVSSVKAALLGDLSLVASYAIKSNSDVPPGIENTDTFTALSLEYEF